MRSLQFAVVATCLAVGACNPSSPADAGTDATAIDGRSDGGEHVDDGIDALPDVAPDVTPPWLALHPPAPRATFPLHFLWGSATAPYQIEGGLHGTDWYQWEQMGKVVNNDHADDGPDSLDHYADDIAVLTQTHQTAYRFGIEMARVFPTSTAWTACRTAYGTGVVGASGWLAACRASAAQGAHGLAYYHTVLDAVRSASLTPLVTLQHFTLPSYLNDLSMPWMTQGWMNAGLVDDMRVWAAFVAGEFGNQVDWYVTLNEPTAFAVVAYLAGVQPPGQTLATGALVTVVTNMIHAHVAMYDAIHANDTTVATGATSPLPTQSPAMVSIAHHARRFFPAHATDAQDVAATASFDQLYNHTFFDAIVTGNLDTNLNGAHDPGEPTNDPALRGRADYLGVNYYTLSVVQHLSSIPLLHALPEPDATLRGLLKTEYGWDIFPQGMQDELAWAATYGLPIIVTENGIADATDVNRPRFLAEHLAAVAAAIYAGANVIGYFHWSSIDNFEWTGGYCPHFGLFSVDRTSPVRARTARPSAAVYQQIIDAAQVSDALLAAQPAYRTATTFCASAPGGSGF